jgi:hypothetical protein
LFVRSINQALCGFCGGVKVVSRTMNRYLFVRASRTSDWRRIDRTIDVALSRDFDAKFDLRVIVFEE